MKKPQYYCVTDIFLKNENNEVLLIHRSQAREVLPNFYNGLGGKINPGETPYQSVLREAKEEAGLEQIKDIQLRGILTVDDKFGIWQIFIFKGKIEKERLKVIETPEGKLEWIPQESLRAKKLVPDLHAWIELLWKDINFFFAKISYDQDYKLKNKVSLKIIP